MAKTGAGCRTRCASFRAAPTVRSARPLPAQAQAAQCDLFLIWNLCEIVTKIMFDFTNYSDLDAFYMIDYINAVATNRGKI